MVVAEGGEADLDAIGPDARELGRAWGDPQVREHRGDDTVCRGLQRGFVEDLVAAVAPDVAQLQVVDLHRGERAAADEPRPAPTDGLDQLLAVLREVVRGAARGERDDIRHLEVGEGEARQGSAAQPVGERGQRHDVGAQLALVDVDREPLVGERALQRGGPLLDLGDADLADDLLEDGLRGEPHAVEVEPVRLQHLAQHPGLLAPGLGAVERGQHADRPVGDLRGGRDRLQGAGAVEAVLHLERRIEVAEVPHEQVDVLALLRVVDAVAGGRPRLLHRVDHDEHVVGVGAEFPAVLDLGVEAEGEQERRPRLGRRLPPEVGEGGSDGVEVALRATGEPLDRAGEVGEVHARGVESPTGGDHVPVTVELARHPRPVDAHGRAHAPQPSGSHLR